MTEVGMQGVIAKTVFTGGNYDYTSTGGSNQESVSGSKQTGSTNSTGNTVDTSSQETDDIKVKPMNEDDVKDLVDKLNDAMKKNNVNLRFSYHQKAGMFSVAVIDMETKEIIKELPPEEMVKDIEKGKLWMEALIGTFIDEKA